MPGVQVGLRHRPVGVSNDRVFGVTAYIHTDSGVYGEFGGYRAAGRGYMINTNAIEDPADPGAWADAEAERNKTSINAR